MATERLSMRQIREILRQKWVLGRPHREVAESLRIGLGTVSVVLERAKQAGLDWPTVQTLTEEALEARLYTRPLIAVPETAARPWPDCAYIHRERRKAGVTLALLHVEYLEQHPEGYRYTQYCEIYRRWLKHRGLSMRHVHRAGEKMFVDYSGKKPTIIDPTTGEITAVELFVAVLGASNYTYAEASRTQQVPDWIASHERAFAFFGGVTEIVVCDQLKSGVTLPGRYEPGLQRTYEEFAQHHNTVIVPARPGVHGTNRRSKSPCKSPSGGSSPVSVTSASSPSPHSTPASASSSSRSTRRSCVSIAPAAVISSSSSISPLRPLPAEPFVFGDWTIHARVNIDYHIDVHGHYYSLPHQFLHELVDARRTATTVEIFHRGQRVAAHVAMITAAATRPIPRTCRRPIASTSSGRPPACSIGPAPSVPAPPTWSKPSSPIVRIPSRAIAPAWASCASPRATASNAWKPPAPAPAPPTHALTAMWTPSSSTASIGYPSPPRPTRSSPS
jgi:transposase